MPLNIKGQPSDVAATNRWALGIENQLASLKQQTHAIPNIAKNIVVANPPAPTPGGGVTSVGLAMPREFVVSGSPVTSVGTLTAAWAGETPGTFLGAPGPGLSGFGGATAASGAAASGPTSLSVSETPTTPTSLAIAVAGTNSSLSTPAGWTAAPGANVHATVYYQTITGTSPVTLAESLTGSSIQWAASLALFNGPAPSFVQGSSGTSKSSTVAFPSNNTAGNTLVVVMEYLSAVTASSFGLVFSDSKGNSYQQIISNGIPFNSSLPSSSQVQQNVYIAPNCAGGANTITYSFSGTTLGTPEFHIFILEFGPLPAGNGTPVFRVLSGSDIPSINLSTGGNGGVGGILRPVNGGTGSDLSTTGGTSQFLSQASSGAAVTVVQPDFSDLAGASGKLATHYNGVATVSNGIPAEYATVDLTAQTAAKGTTTLYAAPAAGAGQYRVSWNAKVTTVATSSTLGPLTITYTDPDGVVQTITAAAQNSAGTIETSDSGNTTTTVMLGHPILLNCKASTNIQYAFAYTSNAAATMQYNLHIKLEAL